MSPRAAWRLEQLGFVDVADYTGGKMDWLSFGLPYEGEAVLAADAVDSDVPACRLDEEPSAVLKRFPCNGASSCVVLDEHGIVMGTVRAADLGDRGARATRVGDVMTFGVSTVRPSTGLDDVLERLREAEADSVIVTRPDGTLVGLLRRDQPNSGET